MIQFEGHLITPLMQVPFCSPGGTLAFTVVQLYEVASVEGQFLVCVYF